MKEIVKYDNRYPLLSLLRFPFIMGIILFHVHDFFGNPWMPQLNVIYTWGGGVGNIFFFMTSGFLISNRYLSRIRQEKPLSFKEFIHKRIKAVWPLYFITNVIIVPFYILRNGISTIDFSKYYLSLFFISEGWIDNYQPINYPTWFLCVLMFCYVIYYFIARQTKTESAYRISLIIVFFWGYICRTGKFDFPFNYATTGTGLMNFSIGCLLNEICFHVDIKVRRWTTVFLAMISAITIWLAFRFGFSTITSDIGLIISMLFMPTLIICCTKCTRFSVRMCDTVATFLSKISMHLFYWHIPVIAVFKYATHAIEINDDGKSLIYYFGFLFLTSLLSLFIMQSITRLIRSSKQNRVC